MVWHLTGPLMRKPCGQTCALAGSQTLCISSIRWLAEDWSPQYALHLNQAT